MGVWGPNSDQNDTVVDDRIDVMTANGLYADANELVPLEVQALSDAKDAALLSEDVAYGHFGTIVGLVREGYRVSDAALEEAIEALKKENFADAGWHDGGVSRRAAIAKELALLEAARANGGQVPPNSCEASAGLIDTVLAREMGEEEDASSEHSVITGPHGDEETTAQLPAPFAWLDTAPLKTLVGVAKEVGVSVSGGVERAQLVADIKAHTNRWKARRLAPYTTCEPPKNDPRSRMLPKDAVPAGTMSSGVPIHKYTDPRSGYVSTYYGKVGEEALGKVTSKDGNLVINYEGDAGSEYKTKETLSNEGIIQIFEGPRGLEYKVKRMHKGNTFHYTGPRNYERIVSIENNGDVIKFEGNPGAEHKVKIERRDGAIEIYRGDKGEEHLVQFVNKGGKATFNTGAKGKEVPIDGAFDAYKAYMDLKRAPPPAAPDTKPKKKRARKA